MFRSGQRGLATALCGAALACASADARADEVERRAADAYERGRVAHDKGSFEAAAAEFAAADALVPSAAALEMALSDAILADAPVLGVELTERARGRSSSPRLATLVADARRRFGGRTGRVRVACPPATACVAESAGRAIEPGAWVVVPVGRQAVAITWDGGAAQRVVDVGPDADVEVGPAAPAAPAQKTASTSAPRRAGLSPWWFGGAATGAAIVTGVAAWSAIDAVRAHDRFVAAGCHDVGSAACDAQRDEGTGKQLRTNLLVGGAAIAVGAAVVVAIFTEWRSPSSREAARAR